MTKKRGAKQPKVVWVGSTPITPISTKEHRQLEKRIKKRHEQLRKLYPEVQGKVVDFITHTIEDGTLYFTVRFKDKTAFCLRYTSDMFIVGADLSDWRSGDYHIIREYIKPIPS
jgi:hypothetical protein